MCYITRFTYLKKTRTELIGTKHFLTYPAVIVSGRRNHVFVKFQQGVRVLGPSRLLDQRPCQTRVAAAPPTWGKGVSQPDNVVLYWFTLTQCCIETISNRQEGLSRELKSTPPIAVLYTMQGVNHFSLGVNPLQPPGKYSHGAKF